MSLAYAVPLWGGIAANGFAHIAFHKGKKLTIDEWLVAVRSGKFRTAIVRLNPERPNGPWHVLCDNERFMKDLPVKQRIGPAASSPGMFPRDRLT